MLAVLGASPTPETAERHLAYAQMVEQSKQAAENFFSFLIQLY